MQMERRNARPFRKRSQPHILVQVRRGKFQRGLNRPNHHLSLLKELARFLTFLAIPDAQLINIEW